MRDEYPFNHHAVFEASAGTGKTYTITQLVLRAIVEKGFSIREILVVTYTDKATAELKDRLRKTLEAALLEDENLTHKARIQAAIEAYDDAQIFTIHAFCLRILQQNPFYHPYGGRMETADDNETMSTCLRHIQRTTWAQKYGDELLPLMDLSGFTHPKKGGENWEQELFQIGRNFRLGCDHQLRPDRYPDLKKSITELNEKFANTIAELQQRIGPVPPDATQHPLYIAYGEFPMQNNWRESRRRNFLLPLIQWLGDPETLKRPLASLTELIQTCEAHGSKFDCFGALIDNIKKGESINAGCTELPGIIESITSLCGSKAMIEYQLTVDTIKDMATVMDEYKLEHGLQSFEDFLTRVAKSLEGSSGEKLLGALRSRYKLAIVDEFQDTDPIQWKIFELIFVDTKNKVEAANGSHILVIVGDPKQAIYGFRNADIATYLKARETLHEKSGEKPYTLARNYRSSKDLISALNRLFNEGKMFPEHEGITYENVDPAPDEQRNEIDASSDHSERKALTLVKFENVTRGTLARRTMAQFVGDEIQHLLHGHQGGPAFTFKDKTHKNKPLQADDIAVLVFKRGEARLIEEQLQARNIPYTFYKKSGIWQSEEALHLGFVLKALAHSSGGEGGGSEGDSAFRKMLLTRFFGCKPEQLTALENSATGSELQSLYRSWQHLAQTKHWAELFRSIMEDTGAFWQESLAQDGARRLANYRHIIQTLTQVAYTHGLDLLGLLDVLEEKRISSSEDESGLQPLETERPAVKIMTIHASKGLEFPVVFLAGGFTGKNNSRSYFKHHDQEHVVFQLDTDDTDAKNAAKAEETAETRRLLYVAQTRAMFKLYLPYPDKYPYSSGPLVEVLKPVLDQADFEKVPELCSVATARPQPNLPMPLQNSAESAAVLARPTEPMPEPLFPQYDASSLYKRRVEIRSFSGIVGHQARPNPFDEKAARVDDDLSEQPDLTPAPEERLRDPFPSGTTPGNILHDILEKLDFNAVATAATAKELLQVGSASQRLIQNLCDRLPITKSTDGAKNTGENAVPERVAQLLFNTLRTPLSKLGGGTLASLTRAERLHELEFHMPFEVLASNIDEINSGDKGFLTGSMDLVFRHCDRWFLLDWKSNTLPHYSCEYLKQEMKVRHYDFQLRIYLQALKRWMKRINPKTDLTQEFGGVFYMFMRGMNIQNESEGVYFHTPTASDWDEKKLAEDLRHELYRKRTTV